MSYPSNLTAAELKDTTNVERDRMATQVFPAYTTTPSFHTNSDTDLITRGSNPSESVVTATAVRSSVQQFSPVISAVSDQACTSTPSNEQSNNFVLDIASHPQADLLIMLSSLLTRITTSNDNLHAGPDPVTPPKVGSPLLAFHARNIPSISIQSYLTRILKYCPMSSDIFLSLLVYFDRMSKAPSFSDQGTKEAMFSSTRQLIGDEPFLFSIDSYNVHRLVITGIVVASKFCSDVFYTNSRYAKVGGLPLSELNHLEFQFLLMNDFRLMIPTEELQNYGNQLLQFWHHNNPS